MSKTKIVSKGYTLEVDSWENDGDYDNTTTYTVQDKEYVIAIARFLDDCIGPVSNNDRCHEDHIEEYLKEHGTSLGISTVDEANDLAGSMLGWSEYYTYRVPAGINISYSPEDVYLETIEY